MLKRLGVVAFLIGTCSALPAWADDFAPVKCGTNQERVWVYDSLTSFDVQAQIRCGENVQIVSRSKGYVKVRLKDGSEGYVADASLPSLPPLDDDATKTADPNSAPSTDNSLGAIARRLAAARPAAAPATATVASTTIPVPADSSANAIAPAASSVPSRPVAPKVATPASSETHVTTAVVVSTEAPAVSATPVKPEPVVPAVPAISAPVSNASSVAPGVREATSVAATSPALKTVTTAASVSVEHPAPSAAPNPKQAARAASRTVSTGSKVSNNNALQPTTINATPNPPISNPAPVAPKPAPPATTETVSNIPPASAERETPGIRNVSASVNSEEFPDFQDPVSESADPACQFYFSAYGLAPSQIKWMAQNRRKEYPNICPASDPSKVDFVVIFTHDVDGYSSTLPAPVHSDRNGFSDFSATVGVDTAAQTTYEADKAHRQFVWVFTMRRGAFDPSNFSPRRRYQFTKVESSSAGPKAGVKTVEDAFQFVTQQTPNR